MDKKCKCNECDLKDTTDCTLKALERVVIDQGRKQQTKKLDTFVGADGIEYYWDGPMAMYKPINRF